LEIDQGYTTMQHGQPIIKNCHTSLCARFSENFTLAQFYFNVTSQTRRPVIFSEVPSIVIKVKLSLPKRRRCIGGWDA